MRWGRPECLRLSIAYAWGLRKGRALLFLLSYNVLFDGSCCVWFLTAGGFMS